MFFNQTSQTLLGSPSKVIWLQWSESRFSWMDGFTLMKKKIGEKRRKFSHCCCASLIWQSRESQDNKQNQRLIDHLLESGKKTIAYRIYLNFKKPIELDGGWNLVEILSKGKCSLWFTDNKWDGQRGYRDHSQTTISKNLKSWLNWY